MAKIIAVGGVPATGKTTLIKSILNNFKPLTKFKFGLIQGVRSKLLRIYVIGVYDNSTFAGTDKLSMACQPDFFKFVNKLSDNDLVIFEGDRLFNQSLFDKVDCDIIVLEADKDILIDRHIDHRDNQTEKFIQAKFTKIRNIVNNNSVKIFNNNSPEHKQYVIEHIMDIVGRHLIKTVKQQ